MSQYFQIHPENPQKRLIDQAIAIIRKGGVVAYPTDSGYALGCHLGEKKAIHQGLTPIFWMLHQKYRACCCIPSVAPLACVYRIIALPTRYWPP